VGLVGLNLLFPGTSGSKKTCSGWNGCGGIVLIYLIWGGVCLGGCLILKEEGAAGCTGISLGYFVQQDYYSRKHKGRAHLEPTWHPARVLLRMRLLHQQDFISQVLGRSKRS
jgi:hypothetical protein